MEMFPINVRSEMHEWKCSQKVSEVECMSGNVPNKSVKWNT